MKASSRDVHMPVSESGYAPPEQFKTLIASTVAKLLRASNPAYDKEDGWEVIKTKNDIEMSRKKTEKLKGERAINTVRGRGRVRCGAEAFRDLVIDLGSRRKLWDNVFKEGRVVELIDAHTSVVYLELKTKKCIMDFHRDLLYLQHTRDIGQGTYVVASRSAGVNQSMVPVPDGCLRGELHTSGYVIRPLNDGKGTCEITYIVQADMGKLPTSILNLVAEDQPQCIHRQKRVYAELYGGTEGQLREEKPAIAAVEDDDITNNAEGVEEPLRMSLAIPKVQRKDDDEWEEPETGLTLSFENANEVFGNMTDEGLSGSVGAGGGGGSRSPRGTSWQQARKTSGTGESPAASPRGTLERIGSRKISPPLTGVGGLESPPVSPRTQSDPQYQSLRNGSVAGIRAPGTNSPAHASPAIVRASTADTLSRASTSNKPLPQKPDASPRLNERPSPLPPRSPRLEERTTGVSPRQSTAEGGPPSPRPLPSPRSVHVSVTAGGGSGSPRPGIRPLSLSQDEYGTLLKEAPKPPGSPRSPRPLPSPRQSHVDHANMNMPKPVARPPENK